jgi:hypothetical protein
MKHVLLALGIVLIVVGAVSMYWGYGIIEDDRGSASFIAGATVLTGGVIVAALSFVLGALQRLRAALEMRAVPALPATLDLSVPQPPVGEDGLAALREEPAFGAAVGAAPAKSAERPPEPPPTAPTAPPAPEPPQPASAGRASSAFLAAAAKARQQRSDPSITDLWRRVGVNLETTKSDRTVPVPPTNAAQDPHPAQPADWLDEALAEFGESIAPKTLHTSSEAPPLAPHGPPEQPEIIGRYEVEGTEYVMYVDGSIDALTEDGVLRFKSMAELKAFFQG